MIRMPLGAIAVVAVLRGVLVWLTKFWIAPGPRPLDVCEKMPGEEACTVTLTGGLPAPLSVTTTGSDPLGTVQGTWALIWLAETKYNAAGFPAMDTEVPPKVVVNGTDGAPSVAVARPVP